MPVKYKTHLGTDIHMFHILNPAKLGVGEFVYYQDVPAVKWDDIFKAGPD